MNGEPFTKKQDDGIDVAGKQPGFYLYPQDLERELQPLPLGAQCIWIRMLLRMHWAPRRGYLEHPTGQPFTEEDISRMVGIPRATISKMLYEMEHRYGTFSRDDNGVIFNRRMVRDTDISAKRKAAGSRGGNPVLVGHLDKQTENLDNQKAVPVPDFGSRAYDRARSSPSSLSSSTADDKKKNGNPKILTTTDDKIQYATPRDALIALMLSTTGHKPEVKVVRTLCELIEIQGATIPDFLADIKPRIGRLSAAPGEGFFLSQAKKWGSVETSPAPDPELFIDRTPQGRCAACNGVGMVDGTYCKCKMGADLKALESRKKAPQQEAS